MDLDKKYVITTGIAVFSLIVAVASLYLNLKTQSQISLDRINQVNLSLKYDRVMVDTDGIKYSVDVTNGSDLNIYDVTIFAPEDIKKLYNGSISADKDGRLRGYYIGDMSPGKEKKIDFLLKVSTNAQLNEFKMEFKTAGIGEKEQSWIKEPGKVAKENSK